MKILVGKVNVSLLPFSYLIILSGHFVLAGEAFEQKSVLGGVPNPHK